MQKHKKKILGVVVLVIIAVVFFGVRSVLDSVRTADVSKTETSAKTTDGASCNNNEEMNEHYTPSVSWDPENKVATITVQNGSFRVSSVSGVNYNDDGNSYSIDPMSILTTNPMESGVVTPNNPMKLSYQNSSGDVILHFIMTETDDKCLAYDEASTNSEGQKVGTYEFDMTLQFKKQGETPKKTNSNYNGICAVFRTGQGYNAADFTVKDSNGNENVVVSKEIFDKYNYAAVNSEGKAKYEELIPYCFQADNVNFNYTKSQVASMISTAIEIWQATELVGNASSSQPSKDFMDAFNEAKKNALALKHDYSNKLVDGPYGTEVDETFGLTCDWQKKATGTKGDAYYVNKDYYYAKEKEVTNVEYTYNYTSHNVVKVNGGSCTRECEEAVVVEYGPPVASKAGLCFEYKVRVTSRVVCTSSLKLTPPTTPSICTPTPYCNQVSGLTHQGGPNEDFEQCIQECDGGEYSEACSNKCYNEVYGEDDDSSIDPLAIRYGDDSIVRKVANVFPGYSGEYDWENGAIVWRGTGYGRWYKEFEDTRTRNDHGAYGVFSGFKKRIYSSGNVCQDNCYWSGCGKNTYLNEEDAASDSLKNLNTYNQAISQCDAAASCTTKTGVFTISVDYTDGEGKKVTKSFPLESSKVDNATLPSLGSGQNKSQSGTEIFIPDTNPNGYAGCYENGSARNWYQAEWSFPGTWINNKTGEISYQDKTGNNAWHYKEDKFCIPLDARSVNTIWWEWSEVNDKCYTGDIEDTIEYNIHATTRDFGYFGWNFDIECFYGLRNETCDLDEKGCCKDCVPGEADCPKPDDDTPETTNLRDYTFRIVDTTELFPKAEKSTDNNNASISSVGRQPGYNWTLGMTDDDTSILTSLNAKNSSYHVDPLALINTIQDRGDSIYGNDKYIDYQLVLDKETLAKIRDFNNDKEYTEYTGDTKVVNGVTVYYSKLLTELGSGVVRERGEIGVNNEGEGE